MSNDSWGRAPGHKPGHKPAAGTDAAGGPSRTGNKGAGGTSDAAPGSSRSRAGSAAGSGTPERVADITPIFVLGSARNGTTWLCNMLAQHPGIAAVQHQAHWGFHESNLYKHNRYWGSLAQSDRLVRCIELYGSGDHVRLVGETKEALYVRRPADFYELYFGMMDEYARRRGTAYWLTKLDPLYYQHPRALAHLLERLSTRYGKVRFVAIQRTLPGVIRSYLNMEGRAEQHRTAPVISQLMMLFETARYVVHYRQIKRLVKRYDIPFIRYEELLDDSHSALDRVLSPLGLEHRSEMEERRFTANSSVAYRKGGGRKLYGVESAILRLLVRPVLRALWPLAWLLLSMRERSKPKVPPVYFKLLKLERLPELFREELEANDEQGLLSVLFSDGKDK